MKTFRIKIQFYSPDSIPTAKGEFSIEAENQTEATGKMIEKLFEWGYTTHKEFSIISVTPI